MDKKKIVFIILFIAAALLIAFGLYFLFFKKPTVPQVAVVPTEEVAPSTLPTAQVGAPPGKAVALPSTATALPSASAIGQGGLTQTTALTTNPALFPSLGSDGKTMNFYDPTTGRFFRLTSDGQMVPLSSQTFYNAQKITWSPQDNKAIIEFPDQSKILYNFDSQKQVTLPRHWEDFSFSAQGNQIAAKSIGVAVENRWLVVANPDGSEAKPIEPLGDNADKVQVNWSPAGGVVAFSATGDALGFDRREILPLGLNNENYKPLIVEGLGFEPKWSPQGNQLLYSIFSPDTDYVPTLWITNAQGEEMGSNRRKLNLNTWADKCAFADNDTLYCAMPNNLERGVGFVPELANDSPDTLYKIDLKTGLKNLVAIPEQNVSLSNLLVSADQSVLYFTDNATGQLRKIQLK